MDTQNYCFCELAPLYALDLLSESEKAWVEQQVAECPDLTEELLSYQSAAAAIPYTVPALPLVNHLKERLFDRLALHPPAALPSDPPFSPSSTPFVAIRAQDLNWQPHPTTGVTIAIVHQDEVSREMVGFLRAEPGVSYPWHRHAAIEEIFMLEGDLIIGDEVYGAGDYIRSNPASSHAPCTKGGCQFFFRTSMDDEYPEFAVAAT